MKRGTPISAPGGEVGTPEDPSAPVDRESALVEQGEQEPPVSSSDNDVVASKPVVLKFGDEGKAVAQAQLRYGATLSGYFDQRFLEEWHNIQRKNGVENPVDDVEL